jgi:hypothetical protein
MTKHIVCFSGGESSAKVAVLVARKYGKEHTVLLNHDISPRVEDKDIKRFKTEVAAYLQMPITYANMPGWKTMDQFDICLKAKAFKGPGLGGREICTNRSKTQPFIKWLKDNIPDKDCVIYYGFDANETVRIQRRSSIMAAQGYRTAYPLAYWQERINYIRDLDIIPPLTYSVYKHGNCKGCIKAGKQHWYVIYCLEFDIFVKAREAEYAIGYSINKDEWLYEMELKFKILKENGLEPTEHIKSGEFWAKAREILNNNTEIEILDLSQEEEEFIYPCECIL